MQIGQFPPIYHIAIETLSFWVAFRLYIMLRKRDSLNLNKRVPIMIAGMVGAAIGCKLVYFLQDPAVALANITNMEMLLTGKSLVGALLGGWIAIEIAKKIVKVQSATGDSFVVPLAAGILVGRIGCLLCGMTDHTYGTPTDLPWGIDFGDGVTRHPNQLYEILFVAAFLGLFFTKLVKLKLEQGELWKIFILSYLGFRFFVELIKPVPHVYLGLDIEQVIALCAFAYYAPYLISKFKTEEKEESSGQ